VHEVENRHDPGLKLRLLAISWVPEYVFVMCLLCDSVHLQSASMSTIALTLLSPFDLRRLAPDAGLARPILAAVLALAVVLLLTCAVPHWPTKERLAIGTFALAVIAWTVLRLDDTPVALVAGLALIGLGVTDAERFHASLGHSLIWLMIGAFVLAAVLQHSGVAERWALRAVSGAGTVQSLTMRLTWMICATAFVVPSTSGRAALMLPLFLVLARAIGDARIVRALALLFPSVILLSAGASLLGAGAHLVAVDFMQRLGHPAPSFLGWLWLAAPFAIGSSFVATHVILRLFLLPGERTRALALPAPERSALTPQQKAVAAIALLAVLAWASTAWHGIDATSIALVAALAATCKKLTGIDLKTALKKVEWNLILFLAATLVLGEALLHSGAGERMADMLLDAVPFGHIGSAGVVALACLLALLSHLVIVSRTARALVLLPTVALPLAATGLNPALVIMLVVLGSGFCQTLAVSAKPVALFAKVDAPTFGDGDLLRLSAALLLPLLVLLMFFALVVWPLQGLLLHR
jgi:solute carrier family 13 (sodium-dependent dicarboxylate transporter), member 2/3/5